MKTHFDMKQKVKQCAICGDKFHPYKSTQRVCSMQCAIQHANQKSKEDAIKQARKEKKQWHEDAMTPSEWKQKLQRTFNKFIRIRDLNKGCVSCERSLVGIKYDAGHFYASTYEGIRFNEWNVHGQCVHCNRHKGSNAHEYRHRITNRITPEQLQWLDDHRHDELKLTVPEIKQLIDTYKQKIKELKNAH
jgi:hypothetical protein